MVAFPDCCLAVEWAVTLQLALMHLPWPQDLLQYDVMSEVMDTEFSQVGEARSVGALHGELWGVVYLLVCFFNLQELL